MDSIIGEVLGISDKTISKWECGNGLPDISNIMPLCNILEINVNELLSGENLTQEKYPGKAEENIMNLMKDSEENKKRGIKDVIISITWVAATIVFIISLSLAADGIHIGWYFDLYGIMAMVFLLAVSLHILDSLKDFGSVLPGYVIMDWCKRRIRNNYYKYSSITKYSIIWYSGHNGTNPCKRQA